MHVLSRLLFCGTKGRPAGAYHQFTEERTIFMNDSYAEWLVKRKAPAYTYLIKGVLIFLCVIAAFLAMILPFGIIILAIVGAITYYVFQRLSVEFEYLVVNDRLTVDRVMGKARRKKAWEGTMEEIQIVAPVDSYMIKDYEKQGMKVLDFTSHMPHSRVYAIIRQAGSVTEKVLFEPNDKVLSVMRQKGPRKVIQ